MNLASLILFLLVQGSRFLDLSNAYSLQNIQIITKGQVSHLDVPSIFQTPELKSFTLRARNIYLAGERDQDWRKYKPKNDFCQVELSSQEGFYYADSICLEQAGYQKSASCCKASQRIFSVRSLNLAARTEDFDTKGLVEDAMQIGGNFMLTSQTDHKKYLQYLQETQRNYAKDWYDRKNY